MRRFSFAYLLLGALTTAAEIVLVARWTIPGQVRPGSAWLFLIPPAICCAAFFLASKYSRPAVHVLAVSVCLLICTASLGIIVLAHEIQMALAPVTATSEYPLTLNSRWKNGDDLIAHFPPSIPCDAQDTRFYYQVRFGQGAEILQLRYRTTAGEISKLYDRFAQQRTKAYFGGESDSYLNEPDGMPITCLWTSGSNDIKFPRDFEIMVFDKVLPEKDRPEGFYWNHGSSHGVAISQQRNEIVYWAQRW